jgi:hypothetical protein
MIMKTKSKIQAGVKIAVGIKAGGMDSRNSNRRLFSLAVKSGIKAGEGILAANHNRRLSKNQAGVKIAEGIRAGGFDYRNANRRLLSLAVKSGIKAGGMDSRNANRRLLSLAVKSGIKAGEGIPSANHNRRLA